MTAGTTNAANTANAVGAANTLRLEAYARGERTVVGTIRATGLLRASRPFAEDGAARIVVSHLGPGMVRGDAFATGGRVAPGAHLIVTGQMATRVLSGPPRSRTPQTGSSNATHGCSCSPSRRWSRRERATTRGSHWPSSRAPAPS